MAWVGHKSSSHPREGSRHCTIDRTAAAKWHGTSRLPCFCIHSFACVFVCWCGPACEHLLYQSRSYLFLSQNLTRVLTSSRQLVLCKQAFLACLNLSPCPQFISDAHFLTLLTFPVTFTGNDKPCFSSVCVTCEMYTKGDVSHIQRLLYKDAG